MTKKTPPDSSNDSTDRISREVQFHDDWARSWNPEETKVRECFEAATAPENRFIVSRMGQLAGKNVLDVGTGLGESAVYFALQGANVTAVDTSPEMIQFAQRLAELHDVKITGVVCPAESLDVASANFDFVYAANVIHHVQDKKKFFSEIDRVLVPGGQFFSWDPIKYNPVINLYRAMANQVRTDDEAPIGREELAMVGDYFENVGHREFWIASLALFLKYYFVDRVHPNEDRYWKRILKESPRSLWWWQPLASADKLLTRLPLVRWMAWNMVMWGAKPASISGTSSNE